MTAADKTVAIGRDRLGRIEKAWTSLGKAVRIPTSIDSEETYDYVAALVDSLLDATRGQAERPLHGLVNLLGNLMRAYEDEQHQIPDIPGREVLRFLMTEHGFAQADLKKEIGGQSAVSEILAGKRRLNTRQIAALSRRFKVSPAVFVDLDE